MRRSTWAILVTAVVVSTAGAQSMTRPGAVSRTAPVPQHPGLMAVPAGTLRPCLFSVKPSAGVPRIDVDGSRLACPPPPPATLCMAGTKRCSNASNPGTVFPL